MAYPLNAYYGRNTWAMLKECALCKKPYQDGVWHTFESKKGKDTVYWIMCGDCKARRDSLE